VTTQQHTSDVLFFTASHCSICRLLRPTVNEVANAFEGNVNFREVDSAADRDLAANHGVKGVPTLIAFHDGTEVRRTIGSRSNQQVSDVFDAALSGTGARGSFGTKDRVLRLGIATVFGVAASLSGQPVLWVLAAGATISALWDLVRP
jgi:thioredoxin